MTGFSADDQAYLRFRVKDNTESIKHLSTFRRDTEKALVRVDGDIKALNTGYDRIEERLDAADKKLTTVYRTMLGVLATIAIGSTMLSLSILFGTGKIG